MRAFRRVSGVALAALVSAACQLTPNFETRYEFDRAPLRTSPATGALAAKRFEDARPPRLDHTTLKARPEIAAALARYESANPPR